MNWVGIASVNLAISVALGAFGAHGIKSSATAEQFAWWQTGSHYFFYHALGLLIVGLLIKLNYTTQAAAWLIQIGIIIFSGSLFLMALGAPRWFGAITPIGGTLMILGWVWLAVTSFRFSSI